MVTSFLLLVAAIGSATAIVQHGSTPNRMETHAALTGDADRDFAAMMIPHHRGAIDMARAELLHGKDPVLRRMAEEIIVTQQDEIAVLRRELDQMDSQAAHPGNQP